MHESSINFTMRNNYIIKNFNYFRLFINNKNFIYPDLTKPLLFLKKGIINTFDLLIDGHKVGITIFSFKRQDYSSINEHLFNIS